MSGYVSAHPWLQPQAISKGFDFSIRRTVQHVRHSLFSSPAHAGSHWASLPSKKSPASWVSWQLPDAATAAGASGPHDSKELSSSDATAVSSSEDTGWPAAQALETASLQGRAGQAAVSAQSHCPQSRAADVHNGSSRMPSAMMLMTCSHALCKQQPRAARGASNSHKGRKRCV